MNKKEIEEIEKLKDRINYLESIHRDVIIKSNFVHDVYSLFYDNRYINDKCYLSMNKKDILKIVEEQYDKCENIVYWNPFNE